MKPNRAYWKGKLDLTRRLWREMRPQETQRHAQAGRSDFLFESVRTLAPGIDFAVYVSGWQIDDETWSIRVRAAIDDIHVSTLRSFVVRRDTSASHILDFDILAACSLLNGEGVPPSPLLRLDAPSSEIARRLYDYHQKIERIWSFFGEFGIQSLQTLVIWIIQNRRATGAPLGGVSIVCAAYVYGEKALSLDLLAQYEVEWEKRIRLESGQEPIQEIGKGVRAEIGRLRKVIDEDRNIVSAG